ncbi:transglycosylase SLT domain-containing protein [Microbacterium sp. SORGH_AS_0888]|uniref:aggregation-promoting factor C-terminal-like domain-containing protein n=1 Tax=Microbacterium sp. SORGH_AS_0888 TaxID=3041791 RepID=UPI0027D76FE6|nr:transglycosylase SLT domain-containing protein [Microbacterium sp. SORGH_AS_0888]
MTSADDPTPDVPLTRRAARLAQQRQPHRTRHVRWSRRRSVAGIFAGVAAVGLAAAYIGPAGLAMAYTPPADETTVYTGMVANAQSLSVAGDASAVVDLGRGNYETYEKPKPPPVIAASTASSSSSGGSSGPLLYTGGGSSAEWMSAAGIAQSDWGYVDYIVSHESGWNPNATNRSSGACGLVQALPCSKVPGNGYDPVDNLRWGTGYAVGRYGSWEGAYAFWVSNNWW